MKMYLYLQFKRMLRVLPYVLVVTAVLAAGLAAVFGGIMQIDSQDADKKKFKLAVTGDTDSPYIELGKTALETFDSSQFTLELLIMDQKKAEDELLNGNVSAYVVVPEDFVDDAMYGEINPIKVVTTPNGAGLVNIFKEEITAAVTELLAQSQKGVYGVQDALLDNGYRKLVNEHVNEASLEYAALIFGRAEIYEVNELGISDGLKLPEYYFCGLAVLFILILGLPYASMFIKKDLSLNRVMAARGNSSFGQLACEYTAYAGVMVLLVCAIAVVLGLLGATAGLFEDVSAYSLGLIMIPVVAMIAAFNLMVFEMSGNIVSGVLIQFFSSVAMCYVSGCFYPIYALPEAMQVVSRFLPTGLARGYLADCVMGGDPAVNLMGVFAWFVFFFGTAVMTRRFKIAKKRG